MQTDTVGTYFGELELIPALIQNALTDGNAITLWRMPGSDEKNLLICSDGVAPLDEVNLEESETGFIFAPFKRGEKKMFFRGNLVLTFRQGRIGADSLPEDIVKKFRASSTQPTSVVDAFPVFKDDGKIPGQYTALVAKGIEAIRRGEIEKIVPSRFREIELTPDFDMVKTFNKLCDSYPHAMVSLVSSQETGTWMGASPELIVSIDEHAKFRTVSLAGTKRYEEGTDLKAVAWTEKEIEEQALVSRYIISCFKKIRVREYEETGPRTTVAGNLLHLKTEYKVDMEAISFPQLGSVMLNLLHPTSAVCGMPLENALTFLELNEGYDRQFYSGYLGPVNFKNESHIYVNLRCFQVMEEKIRIYAGAGVTIDSVPEKEWEETEMKLGSLMPLIN